MNFEPVLKQTCSTNHAIILAAGESKRTRPLTLNRPKPLIPLVNKTLLEHIFDQLVGLVTHVTLVVGYRADDIRDFFGHTYRDIHITYIQQQHINGTAGALFSVAEQWEREETFSPDEPFFLLYGDNLIHQNDLLDVCQKRYCMSAMSVEDTQSFGILEIEDNTRKHSSHTRDWRVKGIIEKPTYHIPNAYGNTGIYHLDGHIFSLLKTLHPSPRGEYELTDVITALAQKKYVSCSICDMYWVPVGNPWEALIASIFLANINAPEEMHIHPQASFGGMTAYGGVIGRIKADPTCSIVGPTFIGDNVTIGESAVVKRCVIHDGAHIGDNCKIEDSVIGAGARVGNNCQFHHCWIDEGAVVGDSATLEHASVDDVKPHINMVSFVGHNVLYYRGVVVGPGVVVEPGAKVAAGSVLFP